MRLYRASPHLLLLLALLLSLVFLRTLYRWGVRENVSYQRGERTRILVLSYSRSGSSLLGKLLAAPASSSYYYEPLYTQKFNCEVQDRRQTQQETQYVKDTLLGLLNCQQKSIEGMDRFVSLHGKNSASCGETGVSVVKTIRLHSNRLLPWIQEETGVKVLHLVRDPRDQYISRQKPEIASDFQCVAKNISHYCNTVIGDLSLSSLLPPTRYKRISYEDLTTNPVEATKDIFTWAGLDFTSPITRYTDNRPETFAFEKNIISGLFPWDGLGATASMAQYLDMIIPHHRRGKGGKKNNFSELSKTLLNEVEFRCGELLDKLNYPRVIS